MKKLLFILFAALSFSFAAAVVDINTATAQELTTIKGIGAKTAEKIVAYREANGPFKSVDDLTKVSGIKEKRLDKIRAELTVGGAGAAKAAAAKPATGKAAGKAAAAKEAVKEKAAPAKPAAK
ncbi:helix-hairpin-helix domain-containing protein [Kingella sp. SNUBH-2017]|uniref:ComEA family DNA-binding protein n=1 Tax=Kingella sp. SNUBH-2017 TaxID=2994077 RepID=UPI0023649021|nr:helix-hairpin-helix domain-containing protein [Kingella sp. SNUBH-2017]MDD2181741.1 helix-hairpin-helix domain-containing protein [Kingella sp. SNUBH-2017]